MHKRIGLYQGSKRTFVNEKMVQIIPYQANYHHAFRELNLLWLHEYNLTESHDLLVLNNPQSTILDRGGFIWLAMENESVIGTAALLREEHEVYELAKMTVAPACRGRGISKQLINTCIEKAKMLSAKKIILFSNHQLQAAIHLYSLYGFRHVEVTNSPFTTADVKMELLLR
jgi:N-acetylglutamate synthase-like GNAT family acetyltransferase